MTISKTLENKYSWVQGEDGHYDIHTARELSLPFYQRIIEDITRETVQEIKYHRELEHLEVTFAYMDKTLLINIYMDSLTACTRDVIRQTLNFVEKKMDGEGL